MPIRDLEHGTTKRGSLVVTFDIAFPDLNFSPEQKELLRQILAQDLEPTVSNGLL